MRKLTNEEFIGRSKIIHRGIYDYSIVKYGGSKMKVEIICEKHGIFEQIPNSHLLGHVCDKCSNDLRFVNQSEFIKRCSKTHNNIYDYSLVNYINTKSKINIICKHHGIFNQTPKNHLKGHGCRKCMIEKKCYTTEEFIERANKAHGSRFDYSLVKYNTKRKCVKIICKVHGVFNQQPEIHIGGYGCQLCSTNIGELNVSKILDKNNITYTRQKKFKECKRINHLKFDFYLPNKNICIEFNGAQHYKPVKYFGGEKQYSQQVERDIIKRKFCMDNGIGLVEIRYDDIMEEKLKFLYER